LVVKLSELPAEALAKCAHMLAGKDLDAMQFPLPTGYFVMVLQYIRAEGRALPGGGMLYYADQTRKEDEYQGRVGLVLRLGPDAYRDTAKYPSGPWVKVGDWVTWPALENVAQRQKYHGLILGFLPDDRLVGIDVDPAVAVEAA
jgi:hypothetical protein